MPNENTKNKPTFYYGGQAIIEGVMMRGRKIYAAAVRTTDEEITVEKKENETVLGNIGLFKLPIFRGMSAFIDSLVTGTKILMRSASLAGEEIEEEPSKFEKMLMDKFGDKLTDYLMYFSVGVSMIIALVLFFLLPVVLGSLFNKFISGTYLLGVIEGLIRIAIFLVYIFIILRFIRYIFKREFSCRIICPLYCGKILCTQSLCRSFSRHNLGYLPILCPNKF